VVVFSPLLLLVVDGPAASVAVLGGYDALAAAVSERSGLNAALDGPAACFRSYC
jgi:hypothetical protein